MPDLLTVGVMKAFALGRRANWKDYVDLYFILKSHHSFDEICGKADDVFKDEFSQKLFRMQLGFLGQMEYSEPVEYLFPNPPSDEEIPEFLIQESIRF